MIAALRRAAAYSGRLIEAAVNARTLARTVRILARQLDNAHLLAAAEEARADRAELRVAELEAETRDWAELSGELAAEQPAADALPDLIDAAPPLVTPDPLRETDYQRDRADSLMRTLHATEAVVLDLRARLATAEREAKESRAQLQQTERAAGAHVATIERLRNELALAREHAADQHDWSTAAMGRETNHKRTIADLRKRLDDALRAVHKPAPAEQIPGVAAADDIPDGYWAARAERRERRAAIDAARDAVEPEPPPPTRPSSATRTT